MPNGVEGFLSGLYLLVIAWWTLRPAQLRREVQNFADRYGIAAQDPLLAVVHQRLVLELRVTVGAMLLGWMLTALAGALWFGAAEPGTVVGVSMFMVALSRIPLVYRLFQPISGAGRRIARSRSVSLADYVPPSWRFGALGLSGVLLMTGLWAWRGGLPWVGAAGAILVGLAGPVVDGLMVRLVRRPQPALDGHELYVQDALRARLAFSTYMFQSIFCGALCFILAVEAALVTPVAALLVLLAPAVFGWLAWLTMRDTHLRFQQRLWAGGPA